METQLEGFWSINY